MNNRWPLDKPISPLSTCYLGVWVWVAILVNLVKEEHPMWRVAGRSGMWQFANPNNTSLLAIYMCLTFHDPNKRSDCYAFFAFTKVFPVSPEVRIDAIRPFPRPTWR